MTAIGFFAPNTGRLEAVAFYCDGAHSSASLMERNSLCKSVSTHVYWQTEMTPIEDFILESRGLNVSVLGWSYGHYGPIMDMCPLCDTWNAQAVADDYQTRYLETMKIVTQRNPYIRERTVRLV